MAWENEARSVVRLSWPLPTSLHCFGNKGRYKLRVCFRTTSNVLSGGEELIGDSSEKVYNLEKKAVLDKDSRMQLYSKCDLFGKHAQYSQCKKHSYCDSA